ncbi:hypothetical protein FXN80_10940 [Dickeya fangzhongdai]|uniref:hypothetical protein n=1 Tax=Dickeya fangzhongdai TaxID=1778540 RepID=UPI001368ADF3|nr:hypothetical protein [Dickeya fangzhongdai]UMB78877.1 hypothetical protein FXN80_10940 [Dickeya fangzhongdai]
MSRDDIIFDMHYSYHLELMNGTLMGRMDKLISLVLMVLGGAAFASFANSLFFGASVATVSAIQFVFQPGNKSGLSLEHAKKYLQLISLEQTIESDAELLKRFIELQSLDNLPLGMLKNAAYKRTAIKLNLQDETEPLTFMERIFAWLSGDLPEIKENGRQSIHP